ncbi:9625_t:CDS:2, partial [Scutellospora calospora]
EEPKNLSSQNYQKVLETHNIDSIKEVEIFQTQIKSYPSEEPEDKEKDWTNCKEEEVIPTKEEQERLYQKEL